MEEESKDKNEFDKECEGSEDKDVDNGSKTHLGFFSWLVVALIDSFYPCLVPRQIVMDRGHCDGVSHASLKE